MALHEMGVSAPIENADVQNDTRAVILRNFYNTARDEVLKSFDWNFAEKYRELTPLAEKSLNPKYEFMFDVPNDCLCARDIYEDNSLGLTKKFKLSANEAGQKVILTNVSPCILRYTRRVVDENLFDAEFAIALSLYLAAMTAQTITGVQAKGESALKKYWDKIRLGEISNAQEGSDIDEDDSTYLDMR